MSYRPLFDRTLRVNPLFDVKEIHKLGKLPSLGSNPAPVTDPSKQKELSDVGMGVRE